MVGGDRRSTAEWLRLFVENVRDYAFIVFDLENRVTHWNVGAQRLLGYTEPEILGKSGALFFTPEDRATGEPEREIATALREGRAEDERWHLRRNGERFRASGVLTRISDDSGNALGFAKVMRDVTEREQARLRLEASLADKTVLLREVHHRVKNNLQVIVSLMSLQAAHITESHVYGMFEETQNRVRAIARIHERLYSTEDLATIHFGLYLEELVRELTDFYSAGGRIQVEVNAADLALDIQDAVPLALIGNELVCNAFKHAFPGGRNGKLVVNLRYAASNGDHPQQIEFLVSDDGIGLAQYADFPAAKSMGFHLINILVQQLGANVNISTGKGTSFQVIFPVRSE